MGTALDHPDQGHLPRRRAVSETPLTAGMLSRDTVHREPLALADGLKRLLDLRPLSEHDLPISPTDVVQVDVNRETWHLEHEQVERGASLQGKARFKEWMAPEGVEQAQQADGLLECLGLKAGGGGLTLQAFERELHVTSSHALDSTRSGTTRFHRGTSLPDSRRRSR